MFNPSKIEQAAANAALASAKLVEASMKRRIFNEGEAVSGRIGRYRSRSYRKKRQQAGRQVGYKDLEFDGDLRRSIQTGKTRDGAVVGFTNDEAANISRYQEDQTGKKIFRATDSELEDYRKAFLNAYRRAI